MMPLIARYRCSVNILVASLLNFQRNSVRVPLWKAAQDKTNSGEVRALNPRAYMDINADLLAIITPRPIPKMSDNHTVRTDLPMQILGGLTILPSAPEVVPSSKDEPAPPRISNNGHLL